MKNLLYIAFIVFLFSCGDIHRANKIREASYELSQDSLYDSASVQYAMAFDSLKLKGDFLRFNALSNRYHLKDTTVKQLYLALVNDSTFANDSLKSKVCQQLGLLDIEKLKLTGISAEQLGSVQIDEAVLKSAIQHTENALRWDYTNAEARYNLELLYLIKDLDSQQKDQNKDQNQDQKDNKDQEKKDQQNKDQKGGDKDQKDKDQKQDGSDKKEQDKNGENNQDQKGKDGKDNKKDQNKDQSGKDGEKKEQDKKGEQKEQQKQSGGEQKDKKEQQEKDDGQPSSLKDQQEQQKAEQQKLINERLKEQGLSKEQMDQLLRSLNEQNKKYIQQIRKQPNQNNSDDGKPDW